LFDLVERSLVACGKQKKQGCIQYISPTLVRVVISLVVWFYIGFILVLYFW
jgi:hypothetical protein